MNHFNISKTGSSTHPNFHNLCQLQVVNKNICATDGLHVYLYLKSITKIMRRDVFQAIADPTRRTIITLLTVTAMTPTALAEHFDSSRQAISKHIKILTECELIKQELSGREIYYHFNPKKLKEVDKWIQPFRVLWDTRLNQLDDVLKNLKNKNHGS